ncbi:MAG: two-component sensor histidine kinase [Verrucomicrobiae bacterium]|nr:two-component sensor histidine kinase [Verrucomicrobiae bacterium]
MKSVPTAANDGNGRRWGMCRASRLALPVTIGYALAGFCWILFSDRTVVRWFPDPDWAYRVQLWKGWAFVALTAALLFLVLRQQFQGWVREVAARKRSEELLEALNLDLEQRVRARTAELERKNKELETFTYSVSHDLKAPLRGIDGYSRLMLEEHAAPLNEEGKRFLANISRAATHMGVLIDDLLRYSRLERSPCQSSTVELKPLVDGVVQSMQEAIRTRGATVTQRVPEISVEADPQGLSMALRNLLDNALKFARDGGDSMIEVGGEVADGRVRLWVRDNGIGFDPKFAERIFGIFQRLHRAEEYAGTGIGLAIVRKAMDRMGGRAWAEGALGKGATFHLEFPA